MKEMKERILIVEDAGELLVERARKELAGVDIDLAENLEEALSKLHGNTYSHVITDMDFPSAEPKEYSIDFERVLIQYSRFLGKILEKEIDPKILVGLAKSCKEEIQTQSELGNPVPVGPLSYDRVTESLKKGEMYKTKRFINGITVAQYCREKNIPYSIYTGDWSHSWPGTVKVVEEELADPQEAIAALFFDYAVNYSNPGFKKEDLVDRFGLKFFPKYNYRGRDRGIVATPDYRFWIGYERPGRKEYALVIGRIIEKLSS